MQLLYVWTGFAGWGEDLAPSLGYPAGYSFHLGDWPQESHTPIELKGLLGCWAWWLEKLFDFDIQYVPSI